MLAVKPNKLEDCELWESETFAGYLDDQSGDNRKRQGNFDNEARAAAGSRHHIDGSANLLDIAAYDIHADAAAGNAGDFQCGRKTRSENQIVDLGLPGW